MRRKSENKIKKIERKKDTKTKKVEEKDIEVIKIIPKRKEKQGFTSKIRSTQIAEQIVASTTQGTTIATTINYLKCSKCLAWELRLHQQLKINDNLTQEMEKQKRIVQILINETSMLKKQRDTFKEALKQI